MSVVDSLSKVLPDWFSIYDVKLQVTLAVLLWTTLLGAYFASRNKKLIALNPEQYQAFKLIKKQELNHDTRLLRFALQSPKHVLGLPIGQHISLKYEENGKMVTRSYTPTSSDDELGYVDFVIKVYFPDKHPKFPEGGKMSHYLEKLSVGDSVDMRGPKGSLTYKRHGNFAIKKRGDRHIKQIGMIAGGTGITPMLQIIRAIIKEGSAVQMQLLFANQTEFDILLREEIEALAVQHPNLSYHYTVDRAPTDKVWKYSEGYVNESMLKAHMPAPGSETLILMCGPTPMVKFACTPNLTKLGYTDDMLFSF